MKRFTHSIGRAVLTAGRTFTARGFFAVLALTLASQLSAQTMVKYMQTLPGKGSKCRIDGTSSIHDWHMESPIIAGSFEVDAAVKFDPSQTTLAGASNGKVTAKANVRIPVRTMKSYNPKMDEVYKKHMEERKYRNMTYTLKELTVKKGERKAGTPFELISKGDMTIHGVTKTIEMPVQIQPAAANQLKISGKTTLKMSDFGVHPPNPKLPVGEITTGDEIKLTVNWVVQKK